jgi:hypothetical protein
MLPEQPSAPRTKSGPVVARTASGKLRRPSVAGGTSVRSRTGAAIGWVVGLAIATASGVLTYRHCTADESWSIASRYHSPHLLVTMEMPPGEAWRGHEELRESRTEGKNWMRMEGFYRGGSHTDPVEGLMVLRVHAPGALPTEVDLDEFQRRMAQLGRQMVTAGKVVVPDLECALEPGVRTEPTGACRGTGTYGGQTSELYMLFWQDSVDDLMAVIYVAKGEMEDKLPDVKRFISGITVQ